MRLSRIYYAGDLNLAQNIELDSAAARHISQVLRLSTGASLIIFNGQGKQYSAVIEQIVDKKVVCSILAVQHIGRESPVKVRLAQGLIRGERMDYVIQKATELGVSEIQPIITSRSAVKLSPQRMAKRLQHWQGVIVGACEQCGRNILPILHPLSTLPLFATQAKGLKWVLCPQAKQHISEVGWDNIQPIVLIIGPEGGLTERELSILQAVGFVQIRLGPRTLRTETAGIAALAAIGALWGDF